MFPKRKTFLVLIALLLSSSNQSWAHGGGGGGGHMGGGGFGGQSMSFGHSMGSFHPSSFSSSGHMSGFPSNFGVGHSFGHIEGAHSNPMWSPYFSHEAEMSAPASHGFGHSLGRFFGFHSTPHVPEAGTPLSPGLGRVVSPGSSAIAINPGTGLVKMPASINPYFGNFNPYFNRWGYNNYWRQRWYNPYNNYGSNFGYPYYSPYSPFFFSSFYPLTFPNMGLYPYQYGLDPSFGASTTFSSGYYADPNYDYNNTTSYNDGWTPPAYDPSSGIVDPDLVPFDMSAPPAPPVQNDSDANSGYRLPQQPSGWTP